MIKLELPEKPEKLTEELQTKLTEDFKKDHEKRVWNIQWLKDILLEMSYGKCVFSEIRLQEEGKYAQVEHFLPKSLYPSKVVEWGNLLPICNVCNSKKNKTDPSKIPLVNPMVDNPKDYFYIIGGRYVDKDNKARMTIEVFDLNNNNHFRIPRHRIEKKIQYTLELIYNVAKKEIQVRGLKELMSESGRKESFSATRSTFILQNETYVKLKESLKTDKLWDVEFQSLEKELNFCSLPK